MESIKYYKTAKSAGSSLRCGDATEAAADCATPPQPLRVHLAGAYQHRQPLAYGPVLQAVSKEVILCETADSADLVVLAHTKDLGQMGPKLRKWLRNDQRLALLSEEPFWDTIWGADPLSRQQIHATPHGPLAISVLNHATSTVFDFDRIPYLILTDPRFQAHYAHRFRRNAQLGAADWQRHFASQTKIVFMAERRRKAIYDIDVPKADIFGLAAWRTRLAELCTDPRVSRCGKGWPGHQQNRQALPYWHADKLSVLDGRCLILSALENTHQSSYISEKIFDAFAVGAVPLYMAGPAHRIHDLLPDRGWLNLYGLSEKAAARRLQAFYPDEAFLVGYAESQRRLAEMFCNPAVARTELRLLAERLTAELRQVMDAAVLLRNS